MRYFTDDINTLDKLRKQYRDLLKVYHPDNVGGSTEATQEINAEYDTLFALLKDKHESQKTSETSTDMKYDFAEDEMLREMLSKVICFIGIQIEIIGAWIWISGNTYQHRKELSKLGFKFAGQKKCWYWHSEAFRKKSRKTLSMADIRNYYGSTNINPEQRELLEA